MLLRGDEDADPFRPPKALSTSSLLLCRRSLCVDWPSPSGLVLSRRGGLRRGAAPRVVGISLRPPAASTRCTTLRAWEAGHRCWARQRTPATQEPAACRCRRLPTRRHPHCRLRTHRRRTLPQGGPAARPPPVLRHSAAQQHAPPRLSHAHRLAPSTSSSMRGFILQ